MATGKRQDVILTFLAHFWPIEYSSQTILDHFEWADQTKRSVVAALEKKELIENHATGLTPQYQLTPKGWHYLHLTRRLPVRVGSWECYFCEGISVDVPTPVPINGKIIRSCGECGEEWQGIPHEKGEQAYDYVTRRSTRKDFRELNIVLRKMAKA